MPEISDLKELLKHELKDLYSAEVQILEALPAMIERASNPKLKNALKDHYKVTQGQKKRLDQVQKLLGKEKKEDKGFFANLFSSDEGEEHCKAMEGLVEEGQTMMSEDMTPEVMDAAIIAAAQKIEHYEISSYGTARAFALQLGLKQVANILEATLSEEYAADDSLTALALAEINEDADDGVSASRKQAKGVQRSKAPVKAANNSSKKATAKKTAAKKSIAASKKSVPKKTAPKKAAGKKTAAKKARK